MPKLKCSIKRNPIRDTANSDCMFPKISANGIKTIMVNGALNVIVCNPPYFITYFLARRDWMDHAKAESINSKSPTNCSERTNEDKSPFVTTTSIPITAAEIPRSCFTPVFSFKKRCAKMAINIGCRFVNNAAFTAKLKLTPNKNNKPNIAIVAPIARKRNQSALNVSFVSFKL